MQDGKWSKERDGGGSSIASILEVDHSVLSCLHPCFTILRVPLQMIGIPHIGT
jgi:hypothetical protein